MPDKLIQLGRKICGVQQAETVLKRIAQAMSEILENTRASERIPRPTMAENIPVWRNEMAYDSH